MMKRAATYIGGERIDISHDRSYYIDEFSLDGDRFVILRLVNVDTQYESVTRLYKNNDVSNTNIMMYEIEKEKSKIHYYI